MPFPTAKNEIPPDLRKGNKKSELEHHILEKKNHSKNNGTMIKIIIYQK
jgi:hypothetical protein